MLPPLLAAYERTGDAPGARNLLSVMSEHYRGIAPVLALTRLVEVAAGVAGARAHPASQRTDRPSVRGEAARIGQARAAGPKPARTRPSSTHHTYHTPLHHKRNP